LHPKRLLRGSKVCPVTGMKS